MLILAFKELVWSTAVGDPCECFPLQKLAVLADCPLPCFSFTFEQVLLAGFAGCTEMDHG
jgi:hypothetical protein